MAPPEGGAVKGLYLRWSILIVVFSVIGFLAISRYDREVRTISPKVLLSESPNTEKRLMGMIDAGSLKGGSDGMPFRFSLSSEGAKAPVVFSGDDRESLRDLKTIVVIGRWQADKGVFEAGEIALTPNYGFITSAYVFSLIPLILLVFSMERRVALLYVMIKDEKVYQAEV